MGRKAFLVEREIGDSLRMHALPEDVKGKIEAIADGSDIELTVESDLGPDGLMGKQWLVTTKDRVYVVSGDHGDPAVLHNLAIKDLVEVNAETLVGNGCLIATHGGEFVPLIRYSNAVSKEFSHIARRLTALAKGEEPPVTTEEDVTRRCKNCDFPLETGSTICPNCVNRGQAVKRLLAYVQPYRNLSLFGAFLMLVSNGLALTPPWLTKVLLDGVLIKAQPYKGNVPPSVKANLVHLLALIILILVSTRLISTITGIIQGRLTGYLGSRIVHDIRMDLYSAMERLTVGFFDKRQTGAVISRVSQDTRSLQEFLSQDVQFMIANTLILIGVLVILFVSNWKLALLTILPVPIAAGAATIIFRRMRYIFRRVWHRWSKLHGVMSDSLQGLRVVKAFAQEDKEVRRFERRSVDLYTAEMNAIQTIHTLFPILWFVMTAGQFIVWYVGGNMVMSDMQVTTGTLVMFIGYIGMLYGPLQIVTRIWDWTGRCLAASERVFEIMDSQREETDPESQVRVPNMKGHVKFNKVTFGYDKNHPVLHDIELEVQPGEMIGLVGHSGAGKSTMMNLLARFYIAQEGSIEIDSVDVRQMSLADIRSQIGLVSQESYLFSGTIGENIAYAKPGATAEEVIRAAKAANAHDFICNLPDGYETQVGERGQSLSGGERQRISIARAILHDPKILILDEATSSVDSATEKQIQEALARLVKDRTTFAIAHRLSTIRNSSKLLVLEKGRQAELGSHDELLEKGGTYAKLVEMQAELSKVVAVGG